MVRPVLCYSLLAMTSRDAEDSLTELREDASALYDMTWGKSWPYQHSSAISKSELTIPIDRNDSDDADNVYGGVAVSLDVPDKLEYVCYDNVRDVGKILLLTGIENVLIVRREYVLLREMMDKRAECGFVVTGQPGIGS